MTDSVVVALDDAGEITSRLEYGPFGTSPGTPVDSPLGTSIPAGFAGKLLDTETGLYCFGLRYYDPRLGRFLTVDPVEGNITNPESLHGYQFCYNNPLRYHDPTGATPGEFANEVINGTGEVGHTAGQKFGYAVGWVMSSPARLWAHVTGDEKRSRYVDKLCEDFGNEVMGPAVDATTSTITEFYVDRLRLGEGAASAIDKAEKGDYLGAAADLLTDLSRGLAIRGNIKSLGSLANGSPSTTSGSSSGETPSRSSRRAKGAKQPQVVGPTHSDTSLTGGTTTDRWWTRQWPGHRPTSVSTI